MNYEKVYKEALERAKPLIGKEMATKRKPFYDERFGQWCISYKLKDGGYGAVWGNTEEDCVNLYEKIKRKI